MRNLKQHISGECPEEVLGAERTEIPLPGKGTRRKYAELKTAYFRRVPQRKFWEQSGQKILCPDKGTRRKYAELKTAYFRRVPRGSSGSRADRNSSAR